MEYIETGKVIYLTITSGLVGFSIAMAINSYPENWRFNPVNHGYGGPLKKRIAGTEAETIPLPPQAPAGRTIREGQVPVPPPKSGVNYVYLEYLLNGAQNFQKNDSPESELHFLNGLTRFAELYEKSLTERLGYSTKIIPKRPERPTFDQPKPRI